MKRKLKKKITLKRKFIKGTYRVGKNIKNIASDKLVSSIANVAYGRGYSLIKPSRRLKRKEKESFAVAWNTAKEYKKLHPHATGDELSIVHHKARGKNDNQILAGGIVIALIVIGVIVFALSIL